MERVNVSTDTTTREPSDARQASGRAKFHLLAHNPGKRRTEIIYVVWFLVILPIQVWVTVHLSYDKPNDPALMFQAILMALGPLILPCVLRAPEDKGRPLSELYGFRMAIYLLIWGVVGGYIGTDAWYEVLHGHFAFNTNLNPNGVPLFMLPMTVGVFSLYTVILGTLYRVATQILNRTNSALAQDNLVRHAVLCALLATIIPLVETFAYESPNYCFDSAAGMWGLNVLIYGAWHFASMLFYTRWDTEPGKRNTMSNTILSGFATVGIVMVLMSITTNFIAPNFVRVEHGLRQVNDWSPTNCLGPKP